MVWHESRPEEHDPVSVVDRASARDIYRWCEITFDQRAAGDSDCTLVALMSCTGDVACCSCDHCGKVVHPCAYFHNDYFAILLIVH